jgi:hypothetical protein
MKRSDWGQQAMKLVLSEVEGQAIGGEANANTSPQPRSGVELIFSNPQSLRFIGGYYC